MIDWIEIKNFKSIIDLKMDLGRVNVIIGANGCGKTNILEAISFASAASQDKLDNEFLFNRGIRVTTHEFMYSAFEDVAGEKEPIVVNISSKEQPLSRILIVSYIKEAKKWINHTDAADPDRIQRLFDALREKGNLSKEAESLLDIKIWDTKDKNPEFYKTIKDALISKPELDSFLVYTPIEHHLREGSMLSPITPLGIKGNGLLQYLKEIVLEEKNHEMIESINEGLHLLDWFDSFSIPDNLLSNEYKLNIGDRYLKESLRHFDQRSTNEGFLYLLFYLTLFNSKETPTFFAIDNIEASFNPKLCTRLVKYLIEVAKGNNKQVILTTHSPYVLDGLDLSDDEQRLFVARRDIDGHTRIERIPHKKNRNMRLSDLWMSGLIGGLPDNF